MPSTTTFKTKNNKGPIYKAVSERKNQENNGFKKNFEWTTDISTRNSFEILQDLEENEKSSAKKQVKTPNKKLYLKINKERREEKRKTKRNTNTGKSRVLLLADSHGRGCGRLLQEELGKQFSVTSVFKPNAKLEGVIEHIDDMTQDFNENDYVIVVGGTNNVDMDFDTENCDDLDVKILEPIVQDTNVIIPTIPFYFDNSLLNKKIAECNRIRNKNILDLANKHKTMVLISNSNKFTRDDHTEHGLHLNMKGKTKLCTLLAKTIRQNVRLRTVENTCSDLMSPQNTQTPPPTPTQLFTPRVSLSPTPFLGFTTPQVPTSETASPSGSQTIPHTSVNKTLNWETTPSLPQK